MQTINLSFVHVQWVGSDDMLYVNINDEVYTIRYWGLYSAQYAISHLLTFKKETPHIITHHTDYSVIATPYIAYILKHPRAYTDPETLVQEFIAALPDGTETVDSVTYRRKST